jgi:hypothetical protein
MVFWSQTIESRSLFSNLKIKNNYESSYNKCTW